MIMQQVIPDFGIQEIFARGIRNPENISLEESGVLLLGIRNFDSEIRNKINPGSRPLESRIHRGEILLPVFEIWSPHHTSILSSFVLLKSNYSQGSFRPSSQSMDSW